MGVTAIIGYLFRYGTGNKLLEQPLPQKLIIVVCMLIFLYNIGMTIRRSGRFTTTEGVLLLGLVSSAVLFLPRSEERRVGKEGRCGRSAARCDRRWKTVRDGRHARQR